MTRAQVWTVIVLGGLGTYAIRAVFLLLADRVAALPGRARVALRMIPPAAMAALTAPPLLRAQGSVSVATPEFLAGGVALLVAWRTRSIPWTLVAGFAAVLGFQAALT